MKRLMTTLLALALLTMGQTAWAVSEQVQTMQDATAVLNDFVNIPENAIPPALLSEAYGVAIIPGVIKAGFVVGGRYGEGVLSVRTADGSWSHPVFINLAGASVGWQIGASSTDVILVFKTQRGVDQIVNGQVTLGGDISIAAGPVGRTASAATNLKLDAEIYSYSRSRGLFAGLALRGGVITIDDEANWRYYGEAIDARVLLHRGGIESVPTTAKRLIYTLDNYMPSVNGSGGPIPYGAVGATDGRQDAGQAGSYGNAQALPYDSNKTQLNNNTGQARAYGSGQTDMRVQPYGESQTPPYRSEPSSPQSGSSGAVSDNYGPVYETSPDNATVDSDGQTAPQIIYNGSGD